MENDLMAVETYEEHHMDCGRIYISDSYGTHMDCGGIYISTRETIISQLNYEI